MDTIIIVLFIVLFIVLLIIFFSRKAHESSPFTNNNKQSPISKTSIQIPGKTQTYILDLNIKPVYIQLALAKHIRIGIEPAFISQLNSRTYAVTAQTYEHVIYFMKYYETEYQTTSFENKTQFDSLVSYFLSKISTMTRFDDKQKKKKKNKYRPPKKNPDDYEFPFLYRKDEERKKEKQNERQNKRNEEQDGFRKRRFAYRLACFLAIRLFSNPSIEKRIIFDVLFNSHHFEESKKYGCFFNAYAKALGRFCKYNIEAPHLDVRDDQINRINRYVEYVPNKTKGLCSDKCFYQFEDIDFSKMSEYIFLLKHLKEFVVGFSIDENFIDVYQITHHPRVPLVQHFIFSPALKDNDLFKGELRILTNPTDAIRHGIEVLPSLGYLRYFGSDMAWVVRVPFRSPIPNRLLYRSILKEHQTQMTALGDIQINNERAQIKPTKVFVFKYRNTGYFYQELKYRNNKNDVILVVKEFLVMDHQGMVYWRSIFPYHSIVYNHNITKDSNATNKITHQRITITPEKITSEASEISIDDAVSANSCLNWIRLNEASRYSDTVNITISSNEHISFLVDYETPKLFFNDRHLTAKQRYDMQDGYEETVLCPFKRAWENVSIKMIENQLHIISLVQKYPNTYE